MLQALLCDGQPDCRDGSDEIEHCHCYQLGEASCHTSGRCINRQKVSENKLIFKLSLQYMYNNPR